jgi:hypothetical protein
MNAGASCKTTKSKIPGSNFSPIILPEDYDTLHPMTSSRFENHDFSGLKRNG